MHIKEKQKAIDTVSKLLNHGGIFVLSLDKNRNRFVNFRNKKVKVCPDSPKKQSVILPSQDLSSKIYQKPFACIITTTK